MGPGSGGGFADGLGRVISNQATEKVCKTCKEVKPLSEFYNNRSMPDGLGFQCKPCNRVSNKKWRDKYPERHDRARRSSRFMKKYGITLLEWEEMYKDQGGVCLLCGEIPTEKDQLVVDHCHTTGRVRGLIHRTCNNGIGFFGESEEKIMQAIVYLRRGV